MNAATPTSRHWPILSMSHFTKGLAVWLAASWLEAPISSLKQNYGTRGTAAGPYTIFPYVIAAYDGLHEYLPQMGRFYARARSLANALSQLPGVMTVPDPPQTNAFQIYLPGPRLALEEAMC